MLSNPAVMNVRVNVYLYERFKKRRKRRRRVIFPIVNAISLKTMYSAMLFVFLAFSYAFFVVINSIE
jgi:hypothetical protein